MEENRPEMGSIPAVQLSANSDEGLPVGRYLMDVTWVDPAFLIWEGGRGSKIKRAP